MTDRVRVIGSYLSPYVRKVLVVLDLKPYFPQFDAAAGARVPGWVDELMKGYF